jgi:hypothetical protein
MTNTPEGVAAGSGARFFDGNRRDLGWATRVLKRTAAVGGLTVLDVTTSEPDLTSSLLMLDKSRLFMTADGAGESLTFTWASGYDNGREIRIQGVLEANHRR